MKRWVIWSSVAFLLVTAGILAGRADGTRWGGWHQGWHRGGWAFGGGPLGYVAHALQLSDGQRAQIKTLWEAERPAVSPLVKELADESREMEAVTAGAAKTKDSLDESRVQSVASRQGETVAKLLVEKERFRAKVYSEVLNEQQRAKADELLKACHERLDRIASRLSGADAHP